MTVNETVWVNGIPPKLLVLLTAGLSVGDEAAASLVPSGDRTSSPVATSPYKMARAVPVRGAHVFRRSRCPCRVGCVWGELPDSPSKIFEVSAMVSPSCSVLPYRLTWRSDRSCHRLILGRRGHLTRRPARAARGGASTTSGRFIARA